MRALENRVATALRWRFFHVQPAMSLEPQLAAQRDRLLELLRQFGSCLVAYSGGVDSAVVAQAAQLALGDRAVAVTAVSPSLASGELEAAVALARRIGIRHLQVATGEFDNPLYRRNAPDRCYHCKRELYAHLLPLAEQWQSAVVVNGANLDDTGDHRPGMVAAAEQGVRSPLLECGLTKSDVRALAAHWELPVWDKPAMPCLSSRIAYGQQVSPERVAMIDRAEQALRECGLRELRVRYHADDLARIELPLSELPRLIDPDVRTEVVRQLRQAGFRFVTLDLEGFRSGSLNQLIALQLPAANAQD
jgi:uncharacterized protein